MDVSLRQIRAFVAVARLKSFTRAAALLHLAQPTLTVQIRKLEEALAVRLFDRTSRSVALTQAGRDLLPVLGRLVQDLDGLLSHARGEATYMMTAIGMVQAGLGVTILPASAQEIRADPSLRSRPVEGPGFVRQISLVKKSGRTLSPLAASFTHHLGEVAGR